MVSDLACLHCKHYHCQASHASVFFQSTADMDTILGACQEHNVQFMDGTMWLHNPRTAYLAEMLCNEAVMGPLRTVVCHFHFSGRRG